MSRKRGADFRLRFPEKDIRKIAAKYDASEDQPALDAGKRIAKGACTRKNLQIVFDWKTRGRGRNRLKKNSDIEIEDALQTCKSVKTERAAVAVLRGLNGVDVPVASAILTVIDPKRYTVIDFRALEALNQAMANPSVDYYLRYLCVCRKIAQKNKTSLRKLDRALWQWSKERSKK
jgi:hypothetical protein